MSESGSYDDGVLRSELGMALNIRVAPDLRHLGSFSFNIRDVVVVERHVFVDGAPDVRRMIVVHFEGFLAGVDDHYRYALADPQVLGGETYGRSTNVLSLREERIESPDAEMAHTEEFLRSKGFRLGDRHAVARLARIVGHERRKEILIFYHEIDGSEEGILERAQDAFQL